MSQQASDTLGGSKPGEKPLMEQAQDFAKDTYDQVGLYLSDKYFVLNNIPNRPLRSSPTPTTASLVRVARSRGLCSTCGHLAR